MNEPFVLGVNYWPRTKAMYWWNDFDASEVADEFDIIADLGMTAVRIFLLWDHWQPAAGRIDRRRLADFGTVCDLAHARGLGLDVTFFTGHMSGPNWVPRWMLSDTAPLPSPDVRQVVSDDRVVGASYRNMFTDPLVLAAERLLVETVVRSYREHPAIWMWNLGNEPDLFARPSSAFEGSRWVSDLRRTIRELDDSHPVTCGLHAASLFANNGLQVDAVFAETDVAVMHGYPMYVPWVRNPLDPAFVPFLCALTATLSGKPTLAEEWGGCTVPGDSTTWEWTSYGGAPRSQFMAGEEPLAEYVAQVLTRLVDVGSTGAMLWCFADYAEDLWDRPPCDENGAKHERHFGLIRPDGSLKPHAEAIRRFAATGPTVNPEFATVGIDRTTYYDAPADHARAAYRDFVS